ncbi:helix-turn-helix domain-containing protein [Embleya sp. NPDC008237]|uniref:helix-turn-helix domain-containing protein n=1 Tax=Embleya sp. NPDC008237 TaxID=3363978 RepID=UPI0036F1410C
MAVNKNPTVRQRRLARTLKQYRAAAGMTLLQAAEILACSDAKVSRIESAQSGVRIVDLRLLLDAYNVQDAAQRAHLEDLARNGRRRGWWDQYELTRTHAEYIALESDASDQYSVETILIPGLLQTEDYTRAVVEIQRPDAAPHRIELLTKVRQERVSVLTRPDPLRVWSVISESALRHVVGGAAVMRAQLEHLADMARRPNVHVQVLREDSGMHAAVIGSFQMLRFLDPPETDVAYVDSLSGTLYIEDPSEVAIYEEQFRTISAAAASYVESMQIIKHHAEMSTR